MSQFTISLKLQQIGYVDYNIMSICWLNASPHGERLVFAGLDVTVT